MNMWTALVVIVLFICATVEGVSKIYLKGINVNK